MPAKNFNKGSPTCMGCAMLPCNACGQELPASDYNATMLRHHQEKTKHSPLICPGCQGRGCTARCATLVECQRCKKSLGVSKFNQNDWKNHQQGKLSLLVCHACREWEEAELKRLKLLVRDSKFHCKCAQNHGHAARCPLAPAYFGEVRWPGKDLGVSQAERDFLDSHKPEWWSRRLRQQMAKQKR